MFTDYKFGHVNFNICIKQTVQTKEPPFKQLKKNTFPIHQLAEISIGFKSYRRPLVPNGGANLVARPRPPPPVVVRFFLSDFYLISSFNAGFISVNFGGRLVLSVAVLILPFFPLSLQQGGRVGNERRSWADLSHAGGVGFSPRGRR
jgi:hypothetical protein